MDQLFHPLLSIVVISKDDVPGLRRTLASIASQHMNDFEVIVVAKGTSASVDPTERLPERARQIVQESAGISNAFNEALEQASGQWVNFLNGGDVYQDETVLLQVAPLLRKLKFGLVAGRAYDEHAGVTIPRDRRFAQRDLELVSHQATFFARELFRDYGSYSPRFRIRMDFEWMLRMPQHLKVEWIDRVLVRFEGNGVSSTRPMQSSMEELSALRLHRRGLHRLASVLVIYLPFRLIRARLRRIVG